MSTRRQPSLLDYAFESMNCVLGSLAKHCSSLEASSSSSSSSSSSTSSSSLLATSVNRDGSNARGGGGGTRTEELSVHQSSSDAGELLAFIIEKTLFAILIGLGSYFMVAFARRGEEQDEAPPASSTYSRLHQILMKREEAGHNNNGKIKVPTLTSYERQMAEEIIDPDDIESSFADIGGLDDTKREIYELAIMPLVQPELFTSKLAQPVKGILLYGKPGTGKTMLAKALAKESQAVFLPLQLSKILNKWVGESNKLIAATFSLAHKLQPSIIFIDELDTFLKANNQETAYLDSIKAEFLTLWDGVATASSSRVLVLGATNKPQTIDSAILRRMPRAFHVPLPNRHGRLAILKLLLQDENIEPAALAFLPQLALKTSGYSGSDLKELCKAAAMVGIQELTSEYARRRVNGDPVLQNKSPNSQASSSTRSFASKNSAATNGTANDTKQKVRPISTADLEMALEKVKRTGEDAQSYGDEESRSQALRGLDPTSLNGITSLLKSLSVLSLDKDAINGSSDDVPNLV